MKKKVTFLLALVAAVAAWANGVELTVKIIDDDTQALYEGDEAEAEVTYSQGNTVVTPTFTKQKTVTVTDSLQFSNTAFAQIRGCVTDDDLDLSATRWVVATNTSQIALKVEKSGASDEAVELGWLTTAVSGQSPSQYVSGFAVVELHVVHARRTVRFDANGGSAAPAAISVPSGLPVNLPYAAPTRANYTFLGWSRSATATSASFAPNAVVTFLGDVTFHAVWARNAYTVTFAANGANGTMEPQRIAHGATTALSANAFTYTGHTFAGWATSAEGAVAYADKAQVKDLTSEIDGTYPLFAVWTANRYAVRFDANGGTGTMLTQDGVYGETFSLLDNKFSRTGYTFAGWATSAGGTVKYSGGNIVSNLASADGATVTLYAVWSPNAYTVEFDGNGGSGTMPSLETAYGRSFSLPSNAFTLAEYAFTGWARTLGGAVDFADRSTVSNLTDVAFETVTLHATWVKNVYDIIFDGAGAAGSMGTIRATFGKPVALPALGFTNPGHTFEGWALSSGGAVAYANGEVVTDLVARGTDTVTLHAVWTANAYTVTFDSCGGSTIDAYSTVYGAAPAALPVPTRKGYAFVSWNTKGDGSGTDYPNGAVVSNLSATAGATVALVARWKPSVYTIAFDANGGDGEMPSTDLAYGASLELPTNVFTRANCTFAGWNTRPRGSGEAFADLDTVSNLSAEDGATVVLYAQWTLVTGELSAALDVKTLAFTATGNWSVTNEDSAVGGTCLKVGYNRGNNSVLSVSTETGGTVTFNWRMVYEWGRDRTGYRLTLLDGTDVNVWNVQNPTNMSVWETKSVTLEPGAHDLTWTFASSLDTDEVYMLLDSVVWTPDLTPDAGTYAIRFVGGSGATGSMDVKVCDFGKVYTLPPNAFAKAGHRFAGWRRTDDASGRRYDDGVMVIDLADPEGEPTVVVMEAVWEAE